VANSSIVNGNSEVTGTLTAGMLAGNGTIPVGGIIMWNGTSAPNGWALCTGQTVNGHTTPNLQGQFIVGYNPSDVDYNNTGITGGEKTHTLTITEMPSHNHGMFDKSADGGGDWRVLRESSRGENFDNTYDIGTLSTGGGAAHENRPPYYVLAFIMRVQ
jgi:microcystin-dependent protein